MRYWIYKVNTAGGPAGFWGDWRSMVFGKKGPVRWGGHYSTRSAEVVRRIEDDLASGDVVVVYQTDKREVVGLCIIDSLKPRRKYGRTEIHLQPIAVLTPGFRIHDHKVGTPLESSKAVNGMVMLRELSLTEMRALVSLSGAPRRVLKGSAPAGGWRPST